MILLSRLFSIVSTIKKTGRDSCSDQTSKDHANLDDSHFAQNQEREQTSSAADHYSESIPSLLPPQSSIPEVELDHDGEMTVVETTGVNYDEHPEQTAGGEKTAGGTVEMNCDKLPEQIVFTE